MLLDNLYRMNLGDEEILDINGAETIVVRVPGGWLFYTYGVDSVFVPFDNEYQ